MSCRRRLLLRHRRLRCRLLVVVVVVLSSVRRRCRRRGVFRVVRVRVVMSHITEMRHASCRHWVLASRVVEHATDNMFDTHGRTTVVLQTRNKDGQQRNR